LDLDRCCLHRRPLRASFLHGGRAERRKAEPPQRGQTDHDKRAGSNPQAVLHRGESGRLLNQRIMPKDP